MKSLSHKLQILTVLYYSRTKLTATDFSYVSNANQYFVELELQGLIKSEWGFKGRARVKLRYVENTQREEALEYLKTHTNINESAGLN